MSRSIFEPDHDLFRETAREFIAREIVPNVSKWETAGKVDKEMFRKAGQSGLLGMAVPEPYGGGGVDDFRFNVVIVEEMMAALGVSKATCKRRVRAVRHQLEHEIQEEKHEEALAVEWETRLEMLRSGEVPPPLTPERELALMELAESVVQWNEARIDGLLAARLGEADAHE